MKQYHNRRQSSAFTLIELLVVIAIIALLIGILLPALSSARTTAMKLKCLTHTRSMGGALSMYADNNRDWYPVIPNSQSTSQYLDGQWAAGGVAGLFSLFQIGDGEGDFNEVGGTPTNLSGDYGYWGSFLHRAGTYVDGSSVPLMRGYLSGLEILTCPNDRLDYYWKFYNTRDNHVIADADNVKQPEPPTTERDVIHYNISYLYMAGLKTSDASILFPAPLWGDETNSADIKFGAWYGWNWFNEEPNGATEPNPIEDFGFNPETGYAKDDNHGDEGGNFVRTDGSASFITENPQKAFFMKPDEVRPGDSMDSRSVNIVIRNRSNKIQPID